MLVSLLNFQKYPSNIWRRFQVMECFSAITNQPTSTLQNLSLKITPLPVDIFQHIWLEIAVFIRYNGLHISTSPLVNLSCQRTTTYSVCFCFSSFAIYTGQHPSYIVPALISVVLHICHLLYSRTHHVISGACFEYSIKLFKCINMLTSVDGT